MPNTKHRTASLRQQSYLYSNFVLYNTGVILHEEVCQSFVKTRQDTVPIMVPIVVVVVVAVVVVVVVVVVVRNGIFSNNCDVIDYFAGDNELYE